MAAGSPHCKMQNIIPVLCRRRAHALRRAEPESKSEGFLVLFFEWVAHGLLSNLAEMLFEQGNAIRCFFCCCFCFLASNILPLRNIWLVYYLNLWGSNFPVLLSFSWSVVLSSVGILPCGPATHEAPPPLPWEPWEAELTVNARMSTHGTILM